MRVIELTQEQVTWVDDEDFDRLMLFTWRAQRLSNTLKTVFYAVRKGRKSEEKGLYLIHRVVLNATDPHVIVDHINHDTLDNRKRNLRLCTVSQNGRNKAIPSNNSTGYKGVCKVSKSGRFQASTTIGEKSCYIGTFGTALEAAKAYDLFALNNFGEFALLNFPKEDYIETT